MKLIVVLDCIEMFRETKPHLGCDSSNKLVIELKFA